MAILIVLIMKTLNIMIIIIALLMMMNIEKSRSIRTLFKEIDKDYYKPIKTILQEKK